MGMNYPYDKDIEATTELRKWDSRVKRYYGMRLLEKTSDKTWSGGSTSSYPPANLDHVFAAKHLEFKMFPKNTDQNVEVDVRGWVDNSTAEEQDDWIKTHSDHSLLYFELQKLT